ncbi:T9SS-dependent choice-of-anchor J family protein [Lacinutrix himadriensis]|uniref:T9SS-dependent choice-of-anchor J family protein n=1 Tax=Lacinutrix himadriensis TaxID=641549 RepID=UPI0006E1F1C3|nr:choice-of-anchor J domain-containing protein [Lacinutrix himadriensis]
MKKITFLLFAMLAFTWHANAQFSESFDTEIPATWTVTDVDGGDGWIHNTADNYAGAGHARISWDSNAHDDYLITPQFTVTAGTSDRVSFWAAISNNWTETFEVRLSTTGLAPADFTVVLGSETAVTNVPNYLQYSYDLSSYDGTSVYVAIRATDTDRFYLHIDEFVNDAAPSCPQPTALTAIPTSATDADISWTAGNSEGSWNYEYGPTGFAIGTGTPGTVTAETLSLSGIVVGDYDIYVQADCGSGDLSAWTGPATWTGDTCSLPITATLEANCATATPNTIDYAVANGDLSAISCAAAGSNGAWFEITTSDSGAVRIYSTGDVTGMVVFTDCGTELYCNATLVPDFSLTGFAPNTSYLIALWKDAATTGTSTVCFEDIACNFVTDFTIDNLTETTVDIGWTENGSATAWDVEYGVTGFTPTGTPTLNDVSNPYSVTNLMASTTYDFYVRADCGMDDTDVSIYNGPFTFTTSGPPPANDDCSGAENIIPSTTGAEVWSTGTTIDNTASGELADTDISCTVEFAFGSGRDTWYTVEVPAAGDITITLQASPGSALTDTLMSVWSGTCGAMAGTELGCDDDGNGLFSQVELTGQTPGDILYVRVQAYAAAASTSADDGAFEIAAHAADPTLLSIEDYNNGLTFAYYPNPVNNTLALKAQKDIENVSVYNMLGQEVLRTAPNVVNTEVNMSALQAGAYFVKVTIGNATETVRIIKN